MRTKVSQSKQRHRSIVAHLLARAATPEQHAAIGHQTGGRVAFFLSTDDCARDRARLTEDGVDWGRPSTSPMAASRCRCSKAR
jgi:hypothetical protein